jgi:hypothetical protein
MYYVVDERGNVVYSGSWNECNEVADSYPLPTNIVSHF